MIAMLLLFYLCVAALIYMVFWVFPRIAKISRVQKRIIHLVYMDHENWPLKGRMCNREPMGHLLPYSFRPINLRTFLSEHEVNELLTINGERIQES